ncbi:unnamed protein product [Strongylus vulgaris]|uniref:RNA helicase n=1 Tax=Strongylus vulgaris TaxID=40348 RepID=A0A3P7IL70_STRVU|nr:unnamed protein product [Strongylus vulgaris]
MLSKYILACTVIFIVPKFIQKHRLNYLKKENDDESDAAAALRLRVLPENIKEELKKLKRRLKGEELQQESKSADSNEDHEGVKLISGVSATKDKSSTSIDHPNTDNDKEEAEKKIAEMINQLRRLNRIYTWGDNIPDPFIGFFELDLPEALQNSLKEYGIETPTPIQMQAIPLMTEHRDVLASAPTGELQPTFLPSLLN